MEWSEIPGLHMSPSFTPPNILLPPTPDDQIADCNEISRLPELPAFSYDGSSPSYIAQALPMPWLAKGQLMNLNPEIHTGLQYMTPDAEPLIANVLGKRSTSDSPDHSQQPSNKAIKASSDDLYPEDAEDEVVYGEPHFNTGLVGNRFFCSCGKSHTSAFRMREHIKFQSENAKHPCLVCGKIFRRTDTLRRHEDTKHKGRKIACPGCNKHFRPDYLPTHLKGARHAKCKVVAHAIYLQANQNLEIDSRPPAENYWIPKVIDGLKQSLSAGNNTQLLSRKQNDAPTAEDLAKILLHEQPSQTRPMQRITREPCDLCGLPLGPGEKELIDHIDKHSLDFLNKDFRCDECDIGFAYRRDLEMHLESAKSGHCGFIFRDGSERLKNDTHICTGHHSPLLSGFEYSNHIHLQEVLWTWENCQLRAHRNTIARLLAERLQYTQAARHSIANDEVSYLAILTRLSIGSIHSFRSVPAWMEYKDKIDMDDLDGDFNSLGLLPTNENDQEEEPLKMSRARARPESTVLGIGSGTIDFEMKWQDGQFKPVLRKTSRQTLDPIAFAPASTRPKNTYLDQLECMRAPGGLKTRASGVRYRARAATRYLLPASRGVQETLPVQYVRSTLA